MQGIFLTEEETKKEDENKDVTTEKSGTYNVSRTIIDFIKDLYSKDDEELLGEGGNIIKKLVHYGIIIAPLTILPLSVGIGLLITAITWYMDSFLDAKYTEKQKNNLLLKIEGEIEIIKNRIKIAEEKGNHKEKENLIKLRNALVSKADKLRKMGAKSGLEQTDSSSSDD